MSGVDLHRNYQISDKAAFRVVNGEFLVIMASSGNLYRFNEATSFLFRFFHQPKKLIDLFTATAGNEKEHTELKTLLALLLKEGILVETDKESTLVENSAENYAPPQFLGMEEKKLDQLAGICVTTLIAFT